jgi:hypothetical protein
MTAQTSCQEGTNTIATYIQIVAALSIINLTNMLHLHIVYFDVVELCGMQKLIIFVLLSAYCME